MLMGCRVKQRGLKFKYTIREASASDAERIIELLKICKLYDPEDDSIHKVAEAIEYDPELVLVAVNEAAQIIGFVEGEYNGHLAFAWHLAVHPDYRRFGMATKLMHCVSTRLREQGADMIYGLVRAENEKMLKLASKTGFKKGSKVLVISKKL